MNHINQTPMAALCFDTVGKNDKMYHIVVLRGAFDIGSDGRLTPTAAQSPVLTADRYFGDPTLSSLRQESDLAPFKPCCDIVLDATAYAPHAVPAKGWICGFQIDTFQINRMVTGPRWWQPKRFGGWEASLPEPIQSLHLRYEYAYGGLVTCYDTTIHKERAHYCPENPVGLGHWTEATLDEARRRGRVPIPQILAVEDALPELGDALAVKGFGPICRAWHPRLPLAGTYDEAWQAGRRPFLPDDFDFAYWNCAHPDLQIPYPQGNETVALYNLTPDGLLRFRLPGFIPYVLVRYHNGAIKKARANLDTLFIEPDQRRVCLVWRVSIISEPPVRAVESCLLSGISHGG